LGYQPGYQAPGAPPPPPQQAYYYEPTGQYANWLMRVAARIVDGVLTSIPYFVFLPLILIFGHDTSGNITAAFFLFYFIALVVVLIFAIWNEFIRQGSTGQTLGKSALGIRLISINTGQPIGGGMAFVRYLCHIVDGLACYIGYLWPLWDARRQTFADKIMNTVVVRT
jgi:uncharacterized RDD family membrane protein YckC